MTTPTRFPVPASTERTIDVVQPSLPRTFTVGALVLGIVLGVGGSAHPHHAIFSTDDRIPVGRGSVADFRCYQR